jgi:uncharacterized protein
MEPGFERPVERNPTAPSGAPDVRPPLQAPLHNLTLFDRVFVGPQGLRCGWSMLLFYALYYIFRLVIGTIFFSAGLVGDSIDGSATSVLFAELIPLFSLIGAAAIVALIEQRRITSYNLAGPDRLRNFLFGAVLGFAALSLLIGELAFGGWLRLAPSNLPGAQAIGFAFLWALAFLVVAAVEEGLFRSFALSTVARGINFWWALAAQAVICADVYFQPGNLGSGGVYLAALIGLLPCLLLHMKKMGAPGPGSPATGPRRGGGDPSHLGIRESAAARGAFWQAAWVTSTVFGLYHTLNGGENWIGVFAAAAIGFVFCVSVRLTGSVFWALGFHAAWDWAETFFYGTADSGLEGKGHLLFALPRGNTLWSGGSDGPEGSLLVLGVILLLFLFVIVVYGRGKRTDPSAP